MALDTQFPRWLEERSAWRDNGSIMEAAQKGLALKAQSVNLASGMLGLQQQEQQINLQGLQIKSTAHDLEVIPSWLQDHPTWESRQNVPWPNAMTPKGQSVLNNLKLNDSRSIQAKSALADINSFSKRLTVLPDETARAAIRGMKPNQDSTPSAMQWQALSMAEEAAKTRSENSRAQAEIEAVASGKKETVRVTDKGVSRTFTDPKPAKEVPPPFTPQEPMVLSDGSKLVHISPQRWQFVKGDKTREMTSKQLQDYAQGVLKKGDPLRQKIEDKLHADVEAQVDKSAANARPTATPAKVLKFNPATGKVE